jgi:polyhydroxybutyrate depolymerase
VLVVAPDGLPSRPRMPASFRTNPRLWNSGQLREGSPRTAIDDVAFLRALVDHLGARAPIDRRRVFATGHSNGAGMCWRVAAEAADLVVAVAPVCGRSPTGLRPATRAMPVWAISGGVDPLNPLAGGERTLPWGGAETMPPMLDGLQAWAAAIGAPASAAVPAAPGLSEAVWGPGRDGAVLRWTVIAGHGHGWPGGRASGLSADRIGPSVTTLDATPAIWAWFAGLYSR